MKELDSLYEYHRTAGLALDQWHPLELEGICAEPSLLMRAADLEGMRIRLIEEEFTELREADTPEEVLKELTDLLYVVLGYAVTYGFDIGEAFSRVHKNNMGRMYQDDGTIKRRDDGKVVKNPNYPKVDLGDLV